MTGIASPTDAESMALRICAERNGACHCAKVWGYPKDAYPACAALLVQVRAGLPTVKAEGGR